MKKNVGGMDRTARFVIGVILLIVAAAAPIATVWRGVAVVVALVALVTAAVRFCPANFLLGINTCETEEKK